MKIPEKVQQMHDAAQSGEDGLGVRCLEGEFMFFVEGDRAYLPGHVYSQAGLRETKISRYCEYHFDLFTYVEEEGSFDVE